MRKLLSLLAVMLFTLTAGAQVKFGYLSYGDAIKAMPDYAVMQQNLATLRTQYEDETKRSEAEFNEKYELFLEGQGSLDRPILQKRQSELQEMLTKNISFKKEAERLLKQAEADMYAPLKKKLDDILNKIGLERGYAFILNTDGDALPFVSTVYGEDITALVLDVVREQQPQQR